MHIQHPFFVRLGLQGLKVIVIALCPGGSDRGRFSSRVPDSSSVDKWPTSWDAPLGSGKLILTKSLCIFNGIINITFQHFEPFT